MPQQLQLKLTGLYTSPNNFSAVPAGALARAENVVIDRPSVVESRRGQKQYGDPVSVGLSQINKIFNYRTSLIINYNSKMAYDSDGYGDWTDYVGTFITPSPSYKMRSLEANRNFYFTTSKGPYKLDSITATPRESGVAEALSGTYTFSGTGGFLVDDSAVAYRLIWSYVDANNNLIRSAPSSRLVVRNASGSDVDVSLTYIIPDTITQAYSYSIYRSFGTATSSDEPNDELQLVLENNPSVAELAAKSFTVIDTTPYSLMGETIYTAQSQEGIGNANYQPPLCTDMDVFKNCVFYANVEQKQQKIITLITAGLPGFGYLLDISVTSTTGVTTIGSIPSTANLHVGMSVTGPNIAVGSVIASILTSTTVLLSLPATGTGSSLAIFRDVISINNIKYFASTSNVPASNFFRIELSLTPGDNINSTAQNLVQVINTSPTNTAIYAYYLSTGADLPGRIQLKSRDFGDDPFEISSTGGNAFIPNLSYALPITIISTDIPPRITTFTTAGLNSGDIVTITGSNSVPSVDGDWAILVINATQFAIVGPTPVVTVTGHAGLWILKNKIITSSAEANQNRVYVSKPDQPEAVPLPNFFNIGSANFPIDRVVALRDGIFFFKEDGIFRISGDSISNFSTVLVDNTSVMTCPESALAFNNQIYCFTTQGICTVSETGVKIISIPIESELLAISGEQFTNFNRVSFGVGYEASRQYMFFTISAPEDTFATQAYIFNYLTNTWTKWFMDRTCGLVNAFTKKLYMGKPAGQAMVERKSATINDFADEQYTVNISAVISDTEYQLTSVDNIEVDMTIEQDFDRRIITAVDGYVITVDTPISTYTTGAAVVYTPILNRVMWLPLDAENPGFMKQFSEVTFVFKNASFSEIDAGFFTNVDVAPKTCPLVNNSPGYGWGSGAWGQFPWGQDVGVPAVFRTYVPGSMQRCMWLNLSLELNQAFTGFALMGVSLIFNPMSTRIR